MPLEKAVDRPLNYGSRKGRVVGVVEDVHFESLHNKIAPQIYLIQPRVHIVSVKIKPENVAATLDFLEGKWSQWRPGYPFDYSFLDERFDALYKSEKKLGEIFGIFSILAIIIACLGLLGLASFTAEQRTKEIGIRKTMGATVSNILYMFSKEFLRLIIIAGLIAAPIAYFGMSEWLNTFAYSGGINWITFVAAALLALLITLATISYQAIKAATANPIKSLRYE